MRPAKSASVTVRRAAHTEGFSQTKVSSELEKKFAPFPCDPGRFPRKSFRKSQPTVWRPPRSTVVSSKAAVPDRWSAHSSRATHNRNGLPRYLPYARVLENEGQGGRVWNSAMVRGGKKFTKVTCWVSPHCHVGNHCRHMGKDERQICPPCRPTETAFITISYSIIACVYVFFFNKFFQNCFRPLAFGVNGDSFRCKRTNGSCDRTDKSVICIENINFDMCTI